MGLTEYILSIYSKKTGHEIARIRIKLENYKTVLLWSTTQLGGFVFDKLFPLIRYDLHLKKILQFIYIKNIYLLHTKKNLDVINIY